VERLTPDDFRAEMAARHAEQHALSGTAHVPDSDEIVRVGVEAAQRLTAGHHYADWIKVGRAVVVGRTEAMREAHVNRPEGRGYAAAVHRWLERIGLAKVIGDTGTRSRLLDLIDHYDQVEAWRKTLPLNSQLGLNHPNCLAALEESDCRSRSQQTAKAITCRQAKRKRRRPRRGKPAAQEPQRRQHVHAERSAGRCGADPGQHLLAQQAHPNPRPAR
jgi:hypothetical protein